MTTDPYSLIERAERLLEQQKEMYGDFSVGVERKKGTEVQSNKVEEGQRDKEAQAQSDKGTEAQVVQEPVAEFKEEARPGKASLSEAEKIAACSTLEELRALCAEAEVLKTDLANTNLVFGVGNPAADLMIVGEAPGENEDKQGEPFVGAAGQLLDKIMEAINFKRSDIYIANILKHRPPNNRDPKPEERIRSLPYLLRQIELVDPKLILCVGRVSATTLLNEDRSLKSMRQKFHPFHNRLLMVTYHPAALLRNQQWKRPTWEDVQLLRAKYEELGGNP